MKAGFEIGLHSLRALAGQCEERAEVVFLNDYKNAFNTGSRDLMLKLVKTHVPEIHKAVSWLYAGKPELITSREDSISEEGAQQGDPTPALAFSTSPSTNRLRCQVCESKSTFGTILFSLGK